MLYLNLGITYIYELEKPSDIKEMMFNLTLTNKDNNTIVIKLEKSIKSNCYFILGKFYKNDMHYYNLHINSVDDTVDKIKEFKNIDFVFGNLPEISKDNELAKLYITNVFLKYLKRRKEKTENDTI